MASRQSILIVVFLSMIIFSCKPIKESGKTSGKSLSEAELINNTALFIEAKKDIILGNEDLAIIKLQQCIDENPSNDAACYELSKILKAKKEYQQALNMAQKAVKLDEENNWYLKLLADLFQATGSYEKATKVFEELVKKEPTNLSYYFVLSFSW